MRKILFSVLSFFLFPILYFSYVGIASTAAASCTLKSLGDLAPDFAGVVKIVPADGQPANCFSTGQHYIVVFFPQNYNQNNPITAIGTNSYTTVPYFTTRDGSGKGEGENCDSSKGYCANLSGFLDLNKSNAYPAGLDIQHPKTLNGAGNAGRWQVVVCSTKSFTPTDCDVHYNPSASGNIVATGEFNVTNAPVTNPGGVKPPPGLPTIDILSQGQCLYRAGDNVVIKKVKKDYPDPNGEIMYTWWWDGKRNYTDIPKSKSSSDEFSIEIPGVCNTVNPESCTQNLVNSTDQGKSTVRLCVDFKERYLFSAVSQFGQNCINLTFQNQLISAGTNTSCNPDTRGSTEECTPDIVKKCTLDGKLCNLGKCAASVSSSAKTCKDSGTIQTAIGCIHTDPALLLSDLFSFTPPIMGLIAFLMMVYSGIKMILSGGNPQAIGGARDMFINAVIGLLFALFSVLLLQILGADIFHLPGFTR